MFLMTTHRVVQFERRCCQTSTCPGQLCVDGGEYALLRKDKSTCYAHEVFHEWSGQLIRQGITFHTFCVNLFDRYDSASTDQKRSWLNDRAKAFEAVFDFLQLQHIDYEAGFQCSCHDAGECLAIDAVTVGPHMSQCRLVSPWAPPAAAHDVVLGGSKFRDRIFVASAARRQLLYTACSKPPSNMHAAMLDADHVPTSIAAAKELLESLSAASKHETALLPYVQAIADGKELPPETYAILLCLSTIAPVCTVIKPAVYHIVERLVECQDSVVVSDKEMQLLLQTSPVLLAFLRRYLGAPLAHEEQALLAAMYAVSKQAFEQQLAPARPKRTAGPMVSHAAVQHISDSPLRAPASWRSKDEAFTRTGTPLCPLTYSE